MTFQLDTSGIVDSPSGMTFGAHVCCQWSDLDPFTQGYVKALFAEISEWATHTYDEVTGAMQPLSFRHLAPETLARIMEDCATHERAYPLMAHDPRRGNRGKNFWRNRQAGMWSSSGWPPLTPYLADDGKVRFREDGQ